MEEPERWAKGVGLRLGPIFPTAKEKEDVLRLLYTYRDLNGGDLTDFFSLHPTPHRPHETKNQAHRLINSMRKDQRLVHPKL